uniref:Ig-like domain-containing protein n=1 Tax=Magallana gigas TaxID=29159 RepID=A0A8W8MYY8_MAGGI
MFWEVPFFPVTGTYTIYHIDKNREILQINNEIKNSTSSKYNYLSIPFNSTSIKFRIGNLSLDDAGYYTGGPGQNILCFECGVVLIVYGKPLKPNITGNLSVSVNSNATLTCSSQSKSAPDYYSKLVTLSYTWFVNDTKINITSRTLILNVTKGLKYNRYSCTATEEDLTSDKSDGVQINPLYGPDGIKFDTLQTDSVIGKEGTNVGPYRCIVDCNPSCEITWKRTHSSGQIDLISNKSHLPRQQLKKDMTSLICEVKWNSQTPIRKIIRLDVQYIEEPTFYLNNSLKPESMWKLTENISLIVSCLVPGNPIPIIRLFNGLNELSSNTRHSRWANHTIISACCEHTGHYICTGQTEGFDIANKAIAIDVTCDLHVDINGPLKLSYSSTSGENVKVGLAIPVIANPPPQASDITWMGPTDHSIISTVSQRDVVYKHWINTSVPIKNHSNFGYYVMKYKNEIIHNITINAQDRPEPPLNFMAYSYVSGYVNMTWTSGFNGGSEQYFILWMREDTDWKIIANLTDPGKGGTVHFEHGPLTPGQEIWYRLESCNIINCSIQSIEIKVNVKDISRASLTGKSEELYAAIGVSAGVSILIVILIVVLVIFIRRKNEKKNIMDNEITQDGTEMYAVVDKSKTSNDKMKDKTGTSGYNKNLTSGLYAAVDKSLPKENKLEATISTKYSTDKKEDESHHGTETYAVVDKSITEKGGESTTKTKLVKTKKSKEKNSWKKGSFEEKNVSPVGSRKTNDEGLIYIDVDFTNKPEGSDTNQTPVIHGEEDRTEYMFVDFSKKAPRTPETHDKEGK